MQIVIDKISKKVIRYGYTTFEINPETEEIIEKDFVEFKDGYEYIWDGETFIQGNLISIPKSREQIIGEIYANVSSQEQLLRLINAMDVSATFIAALDNKNYDVARQIVAMRLNEGKITQEDYNLVVSKIPVT